ncbi:sel1 repeat family protein [Pseudoxanthomonas mexicana]
MAGLAHMEVTCMRIFGCCLLVLAWALFSAPAVAQEARIDPAVLTEGFLAAHPDLRWRAEGVRSYERKDYASALTELKRAAYYGDKPAQAIIAEMYWGGIGVPTDRALAYAWMDVAAERLYHDFLVRREGYWRALDEAQRRDALERGQAVLAEYGDDVAKPRLEKILKREMRRVTGSRVGFVGNLTIIPNTGPLAGTGMTLRGDEYYAPQYWQPEKYWQLQDALWKAPLKGRVRVGELESVESKAASGKP